MTVYAGLIVSQDGRSASPNIQQMMMAGRMKSMDAAMERKAFLG